MAGQHPSARVILSVRTENGTALIYVSETGVLKLEFSGTIAMELQNPALIARLVEAFDEEHNRTTPDERQLTLPVVEMGKNLCCLHGGSMYYNSHNYCTTCGRQLS